MYTSVQKVGLRIQKGDQLTPNTPRTNVQPQKSLNRIASIQPQTTVRLLKITWQALDLQPAAVHNGLPRRLQNQKKKEKKTPKTNMCKDYRDFLLRTRISAQTSTVTLGSGVLVLLYPFQPSGTIIRG
jgi:hypothetical protein